MTRKTRDEYYLDLAFAAAARSTCPRASVGAVLTMDGSLVSTGYNGAPRGLPHCDDDQVGCAIIHDGERDRCIRSVHAEVNAILQASRRGDIAGATLYSTHLPCLECAKIIINVGVKRVVYQTEYRDILVDKVLVYPWRSRPRGGVDEFLRFARVLVARIEPPKSQLENS